MKKPCLHCGASFTALRSSKKFCSNGCQEAAGRKRRKAGPLPPRECPSCLQTFQPTRVDKRFCSAVCYSKFADTKHKRPTTAANFDSELTARLFSDGFYLPELRDEIERIRKTPGFAATLEAHLVHEMTNDAVWPLGLIGRIAVTLALVKNPSLLAMPVKWRHSHERRHRPGDPRKPTGLMVRRGIIRL